jgi:CRP/FNR family transcriptional regulator
MTAMHRFEDLPRLYPQDWEAMLRLGRVQTFEPGKLIFAEGAPAQHIYIVSGGLVEILKASAQGDALRLAILSEGALFASSSRSTAAVAFRDTAVVSIPNEALLAFLDERRDFALGLFQALSERLHQIMVDLDTDLRTLHQRVHRLENPSAPFPSR